jgi:hypothetical protein
MSFLSDYLIASPSQLGLTLSFLMVPLISGETGLETSRAERAVNEAAHAITFMNTPVTPRKVDCKLVASVVKAKKWEFKPISNFEMKSSQATSQQVEIQARKNMRLNHSIARKIPLNRLYFLGMHGNMHGNS